MNLGEICTRSVVFATEDMSVKQAAELMRDQHVGSLVVIRDAQGGRIVTGMVTDRDIAVVAVARDFDPQSLRVGDIMTAEPVSCRPEQTVNEALALMRERGVRRIPVTSGDGVLVGLVSFDDLLEIVAEEMQDFIKAIASGKRREERVRV